MSFSCSVGSSLFCGYCLAQLQRFKLSPAHRHWNWFPQYLDVPMVINIWICRWWGHLPSTCFMPFIIFYTDRIVLGSFPFSSSGCRQSTRPITSPEVTFAGHRLDVGMLSLSSFLESDWRVFQRPFTLMQGLHSPLHGGNIPHLCGPTHISQLIPLKQDFHMYTACFIYSMIWLHGDILYHCGFMYIPVSDTFGTNTERVSTYIITYDCWCAFWDI